VIGRSLRSGCQCRPVPPSSTGERFRSFGNDCDRG
jgi:hypothetical protein